MNFSKPTFYLSLAIVWIGHFLVDMMLGIWPVYKTLAHLDLAVAGLISGACAFLGEGLQLLFGVLSDKGYRKYLILGGVLAATASTFFVYTDNYLCFFALYLVTCIGSGAFHPCAASLVSDLPSSRKGLLQAIFASGGGLGLALSQIIFMSVHFSSGGHTPWLVLPAIILMGLTLFSGFSRQQPTGLKSHGGIDFKGIFELFRQKNLRMIYFTIVCSTAMLWAVIFLLPDMLSSRGYESWLAFGGGHMAFILGGAIMIMPAGYLADRYSGKNVIMTALILAISLFYTFLFLPLASDYVVLTLLFTLGACISVVNPIGIAMGTRLFPKNKGVISAILMGLAWCMSEGIGQTGGGLLTKCFETDSAAKALSILGSLFIVAIITASQLPRIQENSEPILEIINHG